jgi:NodT family efflux transporter outer membrane factor (OMF) lipoprotein
LLGHRPDIVAARWRVEAALRDTDSSKAAFYPNVNLTAFAGYSSIGLDKLVRAGSVNYGGGPAISLPIFDGGNLRANLKQDYAAYDSAVANYNETLLHALRDVADQLNSYRSLQPQITEQQAALVAAQGALDLAMQRYRAGLGNYLTVLNSETAVISQLMFEAGLLTRAQTLRIELARAFGGGFIGDSFADERTSSERVATQTPPAGASQ